MGFIDPDRQRRSPRASATSPASTCGCWAWRWSSSSWPSRCARRPGATCSRPPTPQERVRLVDVGLGHGLRHGGNGVAPAHAGNAAEGLPGPLPRAATAACPRSPRTLGVTALFDVFAGGARPGHRDLPRRAAPTSRWSSPSQRSISIGVGPLAARRPSCCGSRATACAARSWACAGRICTAATVLRSPDALPGRGRRSSRRWPGPSGIALLFCMLHAFHIPASVGDARAAGRRRRHRRRAAGGARRGRLAAGRGRLRPQRHRVGLAPPSPSRVGMQVAITIFNVGARPASPRACCSAPPART